MTARKPLVVDDGELKQLQAPDALEGVLTSVQLTVALVTVTGTTVIPTSAVPISLQIIVNNKYDNNPDFEIGCASDPDFLVVIGDFKPNKDNELFEFRFPTDVLWPFNEALRVTISGGVPTTGDCHMVFVYAEPNP